MQNQRIRIRLKAFDHRLIDQATAEIVEIAKRTVRRSVVRSAADTQRALYCSDLRRQQRRARSVRNPYYLRLVDIVDQPRNR